ncbi:RHS repeat-associated core domain-containing protein, partial [Chitinispirillales bacterium ANBcel5]|uniref:RHS repeat-associated core domain-containing protein n=1 Tax=Cellulosispirillum alkaliphilum TaxID=3039283 RepID=UPI002A55C2B0|nr:RHS repeat-associated core domain-containing protein [Chitinispirillales bacterium ANBcel5]
YYDSDIGRWVSTDPMEQYFDLYLYGGSNPINRFDPDGNQDEHFQMAISMPRSLGGLISWLTPKHEQDAIMDFGEKAMLGSVAVSGTALAAPVALKAAPVVAVTCKTLVLSHPVAVTSTASTAIDVADAVLGVPDASDQGLTGFKQVFTGVAQFFQYIFSGKD